MEKSELKEQKTESVITKKDLFKSWASWWLTAEMSHSFERMMGVSFGISIAPILKKLYRKKDDYNAALKRHMQFFNTNATWGSLINGIVIALEEKNLKMKMCLMKQLLVLRQD